MFPSQKLRPKRRRRFVHKTHALSRGRSPEDVRFCKISINRQCTTDVKVACLPSKQNVRVRVSRGAPKFMLGIRLMVGRLSLKQLIVVRFHDPQPSARVAQLAEALRLERKGCRFESDRGHQKFLSGSKSVWSDGLVWNQEVAGSNPAYPTSFENGH